MKFAMYADGKTIQCSRQVQTIPAAQTGIHCSRHETFGVKEHALASLHFRQEADGRNGLLPARNGPLQMPETIQTDRI